MTRSQVWNRRRETLRRVAQECGLGDLPLAESIAEGRMGFTVDRDGVRLEVTVTARPRRSPWTSVRVDCPGAPVELSIRPELPGEAIDKALGMTVDHETGDAAFDARFVVEAAPAEAARYLLSTPVRRELQALLHTDESPRVLLQGQRLTLSWEGEAHAAAVGRALTAVLAIRAAAVEMHEGVAAVVAGPFRGSAVALAAVDPVRRALASAQIRRARARAVALLGTAAAVSLAALASVLAGRLGAAITHGLSGLVHQVL